MVYALDIYQAMKNNPIEMEIKELLSAYYKKAFQDTNLNKPNIVVKTNTHKGRALEDFYTLQLFYFI